MSEDKRKVHTDALETLGTIIGDAEKRDAIHLAVEPVVAQEHLIGGDHVTAQGKKCIPYSDEAVGIVDPFLTRDSSLYLKFVKKGERFWLVIYPRQIHSLRHVWTHPAFPDEIKEESAVDSEIEKSKKWIEDYANSFPSGMYGEWVSYDDLMQGARDYISSNCKKYLCKGSVFDIADFNYEFWNHYEIVTGEKVESEYRRSFFTCSC
jgi:hypothetical protein